MTMAEHEAELLPTTPLPAPLEQDGREDLDVGEGNMSIEGSIADGGPNSARYDEDLDSFMQVSSTMDSIMQDGTLGTNLDALSLADDFLSLDGSMVSSLQRDVGQEDAVHVITVSTPRDDSIIPPGNLLTSPPQLTPQGSLDTLLSPDVSFSDYHRHGVEEYPIPHFPTIPSPLLVEEEEDDAIDDLLFAYVREAALVREGSVENNLTLEDAEGEGGGMTKDGTNKEDRTSEPANIEENQPNEVSNNDPKQEEAPNTPIVEDSKTADATDSDSKEKEASAETNAPTDSMTDTNDINQAVSDLAAKLVTITPPPPIDTEDKISEEMSPSAAPITPPVRRRSIVLLLETVQEGGDEEGVGLGRARGESESIQDALPPVQSQVAETIAKENEQEEEKKSEDKREKEDKDDKDDKFSSPPMPLFSPANRRGGGGPPPPRGLTRGAQSMRGLGDRSPAPTLNFIKMASAKEDEKKEEEGVEKPVVADPVAAETPSKPVSTPPSSTDSPTTSTLPRKPTLLMDKDELDAIKSLALKFPTTPSPSNLDLSSPMKRLARGSTVRSFMHSKSPLENLMGQGNGGFNDSTGEGAGGNNGQESKSNNVGGTDANGNPTDAFVTNDPGIGGGGSSVLNAFSSPPKRRNFGVSKLRSVVLGSRAVDDDSYGSASTGDDFESARKAAQEVAERLRKMKEEQLKIQKEKEESRKKAQEEEALKAYYLQQRYGKGKSVGFHSIRAGLKKKDYIEFKTVSPVKPMLQIRDRGDAEEFLSTLRAHQQLLFGNPSNATSATDTVGEIGGVGGIKHGSISEGSGMHVRLSRHLPDELSEEIRVALCLPPRGIGGDEAEKVEKIRKQLLVADKGDEEEDVDGNSHTHLHIHHSSAPPETSHAHTADSTQADTDTHTVTTDGGGGESLMDGNESHASHPEAGGGGDGENVLDHNGLSIAVGNRPFMARGTTYSHLPPPTRSKRLSIARSGRHRSLDEGSLSPTRALLMQRMATSTVPGSVGGRMIDGSGLLTKSGAGDISEEERETQHRIFQFEQEIFNLMEHIQSSDLIDHRFGWRRGGAATAGTGTRGGEKGKKTRASTAAPRVIVTTSLDSLSSLLSASAPSTAGTDAGGALVVGESGPGPRGRVTRQKSIRQSLQGAKMRALIRQKSFEMDGGAGGGGVGGAVSEYIAGFDDYFSPPLYHHYSGLIYKDPQVPLAWKEANTNSPTRMASRSCEGGGSGRHGSPMRGGLTRRSLCAGAMLNAYRPWSRARTLDPFELWLREGARRGSEADDDVRGGGSRGVVGFEGIDGDDENNTPFGLRRGMSLEGSMSGPELPSIDQPRPHTDGGRGGTRRQRIFKDPASASASPSPSRPRSKERTDNRAGSASNSPKRKRKSGANNAHSPTHSPSPPHNRPQTSPVHRIHAHDLSEFFGSSVVNSYQENGDKPKRLPLIINILNGSPV